jgi:serine/threonine protein kinase
MSDDENTNETATATATGTATIGSLTDRYDMLAYLAEFIASAGDMAKNRRQMLLLSLLVDGSKQRFPTESVSGNASRVFVMKSNRLLESYNSVPAGNTLPDTVAVKMRRNKNSGGGEDLAGLKSLATELRILTDSKIQAHPNIIKLLGICWQYADDERNIISPVMLYDTTTLGDLETYHDNHKDLSLGVQLQLSLYIARGVAGLHEAGIIHCDLKPKNILIFGQDDKMCPVVPKIIDFDIAVLHQDVEAYINPPRGTELWRSPEQRDNHKLLHRDDLFKIDVFSLGLVLLNLFTSNFLSCLMTGFDLPAMQAHLRCGLLAEFKSSGNLACSVLMLLSEFANISGPEGSNDVHVRFRLLWYRATRILVKCLRGNLKSRLWNILEVVEELEKLLDEVQQLNLLSYTNPEVKADGSHKGSLRIVSHEGTFLHYGSQYNSHIVI